MVPNDSLGASAHHASHRQRQVTRLHALGPRALFEIFEELRLGADIDQALARYATMSPAMIQAAGAAGFPPQVWAAA